MKEELQKIANTLLLYSYHIDPIGLFNGKMGIALYLYRYARYADCKYYSEFADELLDKVLDSINHSSPDFESGISGVGWCINYLMKNEYVEGDPNDVLLNVDKRVFSQLSCNPITSMLGQGIYLLERLKDNRELEIHIDQLLDFCIKGISEYKGETSLYHLNSILYFLIEIDTMNMYHEKVDHLKLLLLDVLKKIYKGNSYDRVDIHIFNCLLTKLSPQQNRQWVDFFSFKSDGGIENCNMESLIKLSYLENLYFRNNSMKQISLIDVSNFVKQKQESLEKNDFLFFKGLAGFGNALLTV